MNTFVPAEVPSNVRLGHQIEHICKQLLIHSKQFKILVHNLPIREQKQTLGEIDFILKDLISAQLIHLELTYKFYLVDTSKEENIHQLVGPNRHDAFYTKMQKIKKNQFQLLHSKPGGEPLLLKGIDTSSLKHQVCFKAQLFTHFSYKSPLLKPFNPYCVAGYWLGLNAFKKHPFTACQFYIPTKKEWIQLPHNDIPWKSHKEVVSTIETQLQEHRSPMLWLKSSKGILEKFFVVWW